MYSGTKSKPVYAIASFLICKEKIYLWGLTVEGVWYQFEKNCPFRFFHHDKRGKKVYAEYLDFPANYAEARGFEISKNVALPRFASVIERLHSGEYNRLKPEVHSSCYYLSESLRFLCYRFRAGLGVTGEDLPDDRFDVYQYWQKLSVFHEDHLFTTRKEFWLLPETVKSMLASLGINKVEDIIKIEDEILGVLLTNRKKKNIYEITPVGCVTPEHIKLRSWKRRAGPITKNHLILQRINFWSARTQRKKNRRSRSDLWMAVKDMVDLVLQKDWKTLEPMLKKTGLRIVNSDFTRLEDAQGRTYQLPNFVLSEPTNLCETWNLWNLRSKKQGN